MLKFFIENIKKNILFLLVAFVLCLFFGNSSYSLVGVEEAKKSSLKIDKKDNKKRGKNSKDDKKTKSKNVSGLRTGERTDDIPEFPKDGVEEYKMLFDDGFSNVVDDEFQSGESFDVFVDRSASNDINRNHFAGNDEFISQMDVVEAEKKTMIDNNSIDINKVTTYRTRVMAYLTLEQMLYADMFSMKPHGYYVNAVPKK